MARRRSEDEDALPMREDMDVFGDEYEVHDLDGIADGFRPNNDTECPHPAHPQHPPTRSVPAHYVSSPMAPSVPSRHSTRKSRMYVNPFASPEDGEGPRLNRTASMASHATANYASSAAHRSISSASSSQFASTNRPRLGHARPSHPYGMYAQETVVRSPSTSTQSTVRPPQRGSSVRGGPQHPYSLYMQGVGADEDEEDEPRQNPVPVGFPGLGSSYARIRGPDGEEQHLLGEDGHMEQLPPYTRYPEDGPEKAPLLAVPTALHTQGPVAGTDPTMPLMHEHLAPAPQLQQPMTDQSMLDRRASARLSHLGDVERIATLRSHDTDLAKNSWKEKTWKEKRNTRFCGIPFWWMLLTLCVVAFISAMLTGVIGGFVAGNHHAGLNAQTVVTVVSTSLYDASLIATPASGSPPTGTWALSLSTAQQTQAECLTDPSQRVAWTCDLEGVPALAMSVGPPPGPTASATNGAMLFYASDDTRIAYGPQYQFLGTNFAPFLAVKDNDSPENGPAYYFQQTYDKIVVLPGTTFDPRSSEVKRHLPRLSTSMQQKQVVPPGEKPWFCVFNNTFLEAFLYVQEPVATKYSLNASQPTPAPTIASPSPPPSTTTASGASSSAQPTTGADWSATAIITTTITMSYTTATYTGPASALYSWVESHGLHHDSNGNGPPSVKVKRQDSNDLYNQLQLYPYLVKIEERRLPNNNVQPYCQQYQILDDGTFNWVADTNGNPIIITLQENDPSYVAYQSAGIAGTKRTKRQNVPGGCHCQWMSGQ